VQAFVRRQLVHNFTVNIGDASFFGFGLGIASYVTVIPLFVATLTDSPLLIGLVSAMHEIGWYLPQLLTADQVSRLARFKRMVLFNTLHERLPFYGMAFLALASPYIGKEIALVAMLLLVIWQSLGGGFTATAWQSMINKIMPEHRRGTFYGIQSSMANLLGSGGAVAAGLILLAVEAPISFALCFAICGTAMVISWYFLAWTREPDNDAALVMPTSASSQRMAYFRANIGRILATDSNFRWFVIARALAMFGSIALYFYAIFASRRFNVDDGELGVMTGILLLFTVIANPILGWAGDRWSHRVMYAISILLAASSAGLAMIAPDAGWLYLGFALLGAAKAGLWTIPLSLAAQFGTPSDRPYYIGLTNTLIAPAAILAPIIGGALANGSNFTFAFALGLVGGVVSAAILLFVVREPRTVNDAVPATPVAAALGGD
jgi:MFS family permease